MCTVSFIAAAKILTSNRDEHIQRKNALAPVVETINNKKIIFPKDAKAGGTWFAASEAGIIAVLLNGAFVKHIPTPPYRKSRGLVVLEVVSAGEPLSFFTQMNLDNIEPFTLILYQQDQLNELRWDGNKKYRKELDSAGNYIWSSATLYSDEVIERRKKLFDRFIETDKQLTESMIEAFHSSNKQDEENGFIINRSSGMKTFSITQASIKCGNISFRHTDLLNNQVFDHTMHSGTALINQ
jgi:uncharacterized protein with NRDE domain